MSEGHAVASFARQTGMSCVMCHTTFPELTPFGRRFKLNGYTMTTKPADVSDYSVTSDTEAAVRNLVLSYVSPVSFVLQSAYGKWNRAPLDPNAAKNTNGTPSGAQTQGDTALFPEQFSLFYAGRVTDQIGTWIMMTYDGTAGSVGIDNTEIRYSDHTPDRRWVWGSFVNNTPGMQDVFNTSLSAFGVPLFNVPSLYNLGVGAGGLRGPVVGQLAVNSVGVGEYAWFDDSLYAEASVYHSGSPGSIAVGNPTLTATGSKGALDGPAPRVRLAYERDWGRNALEFGVLGMQTRYLPGGLADTFGTAKSPTRANLYRDAGADLQYQYIGDDHIVTLLGSFTREHQSNNSAFLAANGGASYTHAEDYLSQTSLTAEYYYRRHYGGLVNWVDTTGNKDPLMNGGDGSPKNRYWVFELDYLPWLNTKFILQYDVYTIVNNNQSPFFGVNTKPSDNNTLVAGLWMAF
ncbi:MAG: hypothetical protein KGL74_02065 [Elusimicrobia bacterium]|nr:hypothetical protein [Elusimicrobiota bacterium]